MTDKILIAYAVLVNLTGFALMGIDKRRAGRRQRRIPENRLLVWAILGGSVGSILGMLVWRHKTKQPKFALGLPGILLLQLILLAGGACLFRLHG